MAFLILTCGSLSAATYYVDSENGLDSHDGLSETKAFQTLDKVNQFPFQPGDRVLFKSNGLWRGTLKPCSGEPGNPVYYGAYGLNESRAKELIPAGFPRLYGSLDYAAADLWSETDTNIWVSKAVEPTSALYFPCDVGNIIFREDDSFFAAAPEQQKNHPLCGVKKWSKSDLKSPHDYYYQPEEHRVYIYHKGNPASDCAMMEMALRKHVINESDCHDVTYENLAVAFGAAHGFGGGNVKRLVINRCKVYYIGGGHQHTKNGRPVRFGNGIEFWNNAEDIIVSNNCIYQIYDAALTNQGSADTGSKNTSIQRNIIWRKNYIFCAEYSFEYWNRDAGQKTDNILFEDNTCLYAGFGWGHNQRPDINGAHLMFYNNSAKTTNFTVKNNRFCNSTEVCIRMENDWRSGLTLTKNTYEQAPGKAVIRWLRNNYFGLSDLKKYQQETGLDKKSQFAPYVEPEKSAL